jgi:hypothetical protein
MNEWGQHATAIGLMTIYFSHLDHAIVDVIGAMLGDQSAAESRTKTMTFGKRLETMRQLADEKMSSDLCQQLNQIADEAEVLSGCRNDIVHALWWLDPMDRHSPVSSRRINPMKGQDLPPEHPTPNAQDIEALAVSMSECADDFYELLDRYEGRR